MSIVQISNQYITLTYKIVSNHVSLKVIYTVSTNHVHLSAIFNKYYNKKYILYIEVIIILYDRIYLKLIKFEWRIISSISVWLCHDYQWFTGWEKERSKNAVMLGGFIRLPNGIPLIKKKKTH